MKLKSLLLGILFAFGVAVPLLSVAQPAATVSAACGDERFLGIPTWYRNISDEDVAAIFAYLKSTKPVSNVVPAPKSLQDLQQITN